MHNNIIIKTLSTSILLVVFSLGLMAEEHAHEAWEIGISTGYANLKTENKKGQDIHFHLTRSLGDEGLARYFSMGLGAESIIADETHYAAMLTFAFHPMEDLTLAIAPGFEWAKHEGIRWEREYAMHYEATYSFDISEGYHIGPSLGYSSTKEAEHYSIGLHLGIEL